MKIISIFVVFLTLTLSSAYAGVDPSSNFWQLTIRVSDDQALLEHADRIPALTKKVRSPGTLGRPVSLPYSLTWLSQSGSLLFSNSVIVTTGVRVPPEEGNLPSTMLPDEYCILRVAGPPDLSSVSELRLTRNDMTAITSTVRIPRILTLKVISLPVSEAARNTPVVSLMAEGPVGMHKVVDTGDDANRLVLVVLGDGYTTANLAAGDFSNDVATLVNAFRTTPPWNLFFQGANVYAIDVESNEEGADYEDASPAAGGTVKDTYFNSAFWCGNIERLLCVTGDGGSLAYTAANNYVGAGVWDEIIVLVNSTKYGGSGGSIAVSSVNSAAAGVILHEFGHSFGNLADEYDYDHEGPYTGADPSNPNVDIDASGSNLKWLIWVEEGTPLPTPDTAAYDNVVGTFEGAMYHQTGIYRPWRCCMMRALSCGFCPVCREALALEYFNMVSMADSIDPAPGSTVYSIASNAVLHISPIPVPGIQFTWAVDGVPVPGATGDILVCSHDIFSSWTSTVSVAVSYPTPLVRKTLISESSHWNVIIPEPFAGIAGPLLCIILYRRHSGLTCTTLSS